MRRKRMRSCSSGCRALSMAHPLCRLLPGKGGKKKRRRKRKLPKSGCRLFPPGCGRPVIMPHIQFIHRRLVFQLWRRDKYPQCMLYSSRCSSWTRFLTCPLWCFDRCCVRWCRKLWFSRSCSPSLVVDIPFRSAEEDPHGPRDHGESPVACGQGGRCPYYGGRADSLAFPSRHRGRSPWSW